MFSIVMRVDWCLPIPELYIIVWKKRKKNPWKKLFGIPCSMYAISALDNRHMIIYVDFLFYLYLLFVGFLFCRLFTGL